MRWKSVWCTYRIFLRITWWKSLENRSILPKLLSNVKLLTFLWHSVCIPSMLACRCVFQPCVTSNEFLLTWISFSFSVLLFTLYGHIKTKEQRTIIQQYGYWYTGRRWVDCYIWYSEQRPVRAAVPPRPLLAVPYEAAHPSKNSQCTNFILFDVAL